MNKHFAVRLLTLLGLSMLCSCGSSGRLSTIAGTVSIDGTPVESGTIHIQAVGSSKSSGGAAVTQGAFSIVSDEGFEPGEYTVVLQAFRKTGRTLNDPQRGKVEESAPIVLSELSQKVTVSPDTGSLSLNYTSAAK
jgi:hypothetical protein